MTENSAELVQKLENDLAIAFLHPRHRKLKSRDAFLMILEFIPVCDPTMPERFQLLTLLSKGGDLFFRKYVGEALQFQQQDFILESLRQDAAELAHAYDEWLCDLMTKLKDLGAWDPPLFADCLQANQSRIRQVHLALRQHRTQSESVQFSHGLTFKGHAISGQVSDRLRILNGVGTDFHASCGITVGFFNSGILDLGRPWCRVRADGELIVRNMT